MSGACDWRPSAVVAGSVAGSGVLLIVVVVLCHVWHEPRYRKRRRSLLADRALARAAAHRGLTLKEAKARVASKLQPRPVVALLPDDGVAHAVQDAPRHQACTSATAAAWGQQPLASGLLAPLLLEAVVSLEWGMAQEAYDTQNVMPAPPW